MDDNRYQIKYDSKAQKAIWKSYLNKKWRRIIIYSIVLILMGLILYGLNQLSYRRTGIKPSISSSLIPFGTGTLLLLLYFFMRYSLIKRHKIVDEWSIKNPNCEVYFNEDEFGCSGTFADIICKWNVLTTCEFWKDNLIVFHTGKGSSGIHISADEIGQKAFDELAQQIAEKVARVKSGVD